MQEQEQKVKKKFLKVNFDMIQSDKDFYLANCNFKESQRKIFNYLTGEKEYTIVQIAMLMNMSERNVCRIIRQIKLKMIGAIAFKG
jgi:DNA-directed RNA polymerase specialized sigma subunit